MKLSREKAITLPVLLILWLSGFTFEDAIPLVLVAMILISLRLIILYKNVQTVFVFSVFNLSYILILTPYFLFGIPIVPYAEFQIPAYMNSTLLIHAMFMIALYIFTDLKIPDRKIVFSERLPKYNNPAIFLLLLGVMGAILAYMMFSKQNVFAQSQDQIFITYVSNIEGSSGAPEYFLVFFFAAFVFSKNRFSKWVLVGVFGIYSYLAFTRGMRVSLLMLFLLFFALFLDGKIKTRYIMVLILLGTAFFQAAGFLRDGKQDLSELFSIYSGGQILTNQGEVFYTSNVLVSSIVDNVLGLPERLFSLFAAFLQVVFPPRIGFVVEGKPALYAWALTGRAAGGGGLISVFFYFWMDYLGVILIAFFLAWITRQAIKKRGTLRLVYIICVYSFYPRWFAYDPINFLFRLPLYTLVLYLLLMEFHSIASKRKPPSIAEMERVRLV